MQLKKNYAIKKKLGDIEKTQINTRKQKEN